MTDRAKQPGRVVDDQRSTPAGEGGSKAARDGRALAVAEMLRSGWSGRAVSAGLKVIDAGGGVALAMEAMRTAQQEQRS